MDRLVALEEYIGLGCILHHETTDTSVEDSPSWTEQYRFSDSFRSYCNAQDLQGLVDSIERLLNAQWIRMFSARKHLLVCHRIFVLPEDTGRGAVARGQKWLRADIETLIKHVNVSPGAWLLNKAKHEAFDPWAKAEDGSLFYIFNTLTSPDPHPEIVQDQYSRQAMQQLLYAPDSLSGLKSSLYPYQARSAARMIQQETSTQSRLDPRFEERIGADGLPYFFMPRHVLFSRSRPLYESNKAGILAETMGLGKTVICLAVILATKNHLPLIPAQYCEQSLVPNTSVPTLLNLALTTAARHSVPSKAYFAALERETGNNYSLILNRVKEAPPMYYVPSVPLRNNRRTRTPPPRRMICCSGTVIVSPRNLLNQWQAEIAKHVTAGPGGLKMLVLDGTDSTLPPAEALRTYDVVLFSKTRFQREIKHGSDQLGRNAENTFLECHCPYIGATRIRDCTCLKESDVYRSPLQELHWLRIIIDEGHEFSSATSDAVLVAQRLVTADRRWIVSGTPARDKLHGIEVDDAGLMVPEEDNSSVVAANGTITPCSDPIVKQTLPSVSKSLLKRKAFLPSEDIGSSTAARSIGTLVSNFLQVSPWTYQAGEPRAEWDDHIYRHEDYKKKTYTAYAACLRQVLQSIVIKTRPEDVEKDIILPPLTHKIVRLQPSFYDKLTANLFVLFLTSNAVCSERSDQDYLFHQNSASARHQLITNLRQSNFYWTGFTAQNIISAVETSLKYLDKTDITCSQADRDLLQSCVEFSQMVLQSPEWNAMSITHEVGLFVRDWPEQAISNWSLVQDAARPLLGAGPLHVAQKHINSRLLEADVLHGFDEIGTAAMMALETNGESSRRPKRAKEGDEVTKMGVPTSATRVEPAKRTPVMLARRQSTTSPSSIRVPKSKSRGQSAMFNQLADRKRKLELNSLKLPEDSQLRKPAVVGTVSAKLSYLINRVNEHHAKEKIIIFYDGDNAAYYIAQCLEILHIKHLIYAKTLQNEVKSRYIVAFDRDESIRVLLMDIRAGAYGLNVNKASRVYFVNPVCRPSTEAQAIKRAHRIGQTKPVYVETLILEGSIEEAMLERSKSMTQAEHMNVSQLDDDHGIADIIKSARLMTFTPEELSGDMQMAPLDQRMQIFGRGGRGETDIEGIDRKDGAKKQRSRRSKQTTPASEQEKSNDNAPAEVATISRSPDALTSSLPADNNHNLPTSTSHDPDRHVAFTSSIFG